MPKGNFTPGPRKGRPTLPKDKTRASLSCRVEPTTLRFLRKVGGDSGLGHAVDQAADALRAVHERRSQT
jgi:hypothetical protein